MGLLIATGKYEEAERMIFQAADASYSEMIRFDPGRWHLQSNLLSLYISWSRDDQGKLPRAVEMINSLLTSTAINQSESYRPLRIQIKGQLAFLHNLQKKWESAETLYREILTELDLTQNDDHVFYLASQSNLARLLAEQGRDSEAETLYRDAYEHQRSTLGVQHHVTRETLQRLIENMESRGRRSLLTREYQDLREGQRNALGKVSTFTQRTELRLLELLLDLGRFEEAAKLGRELEEMLRAQGDRPATLAHVLALLALSQAESKSHSADQPEKLFAEALALIRDQGGEAVAFVHNHYGWYRYQTKGVPPRSPDAEYYLLRSLHHLPAERFAQERGITRLIRLYHDMGREDMANYWRWVLADSSWMK
jgi:hypothetical protein